MSRLTISLEPQLARELDRRVRDGGHANRSAAVREMIRFALDRADLLDLSAPSRNSACVAHVSVLCSYLEPAVGARLLRLLHDNRSLVRASHKVPLTNDQYLESVVLAGIASEVKSCAEKIAGLKGIHIGLVRLAPLDSACRLVPALAA